MRATQQTRLPRISIVCEELLCRIIDKRHNEGTYFWRRKIRILRLCGKTLIVLQDCYWISCSLVLNKARCVACALHIQCSFSWAILISHVVFFAYLEFEIDIYCVKITTWRIVVSSELLLQPTEIDAEVNWLNVFIQNLRSYFHTSA